MSLELKNKKLLKFTILTATGLIVVILIFFSLKGSVFSEYDYKILDLFYKKIVKSGYGPRQSTFPQIKYVTITNETYSYMGKNFLDRSYLSKINNSLTKLGVEAVAYDIIFAYPTTFESDQVFAKSLSNLHSIYLPIGFNLVGKKEKFKWGNGKAYEKLKNDYSQKPVERGRPNPFYGTWALLQNDEFVSDTIKFGHISAYTDSDGYIRHMPVIIKIEDRYFPTLSLAIFLDYIKVPFEKILITWGKQITIPALKSSFLEKEVVIPIDEKGRVFIPFCQTWEKGFDEVPSHELIEKMKDKNLQGNLTEIFEGNFIFIADISIGISDLGNTPIQNNIPLVVVHASMLNGMLTNTFYNKWSLIQVTGLIFFISFFLGLSALFRHSWPLYSTGIGFFFGIIFFTWLQFIKFQLFPVITVLGSIIFIIFGLIVSIEFMTSRDKAYIRSIFVRYVPEKIVTRLLATPELIKLGGETREISLMMSDLRGFTALSSHRSPEEVIMILNRYFEKMIDIIMDYEGVIDEIIGDGILAFFGAPETMENHPGQAVACALAMQNAMEEINRQNIDDGLPILEMGIAVNTGEVVVGNIGSEKRTKYGAVGSEINFTGRVESFTVGGQVLITGATCKKLKNIAQINSVIEVEMKGMTGRVKLYNITGIGEPFNIYLLEKKETLIKLENIIDIKVYKLDEKTVGEIGVSAEITQLSMIEAKILIPEKLTEWENIRFQMSDKIIDTARGEVYAKVTSVIRLDNTYEAKVSFTSVSFEAGQIFEQNLLIK
jgi:class 3 adenylate cyclase